MRQQLILVHTIIKKGNIHMSTEIIDIVPVSNSENDCFIAVPNKAIVRSKLDYLAPSELNTTSRRSNDSIYVALLNILNKNDCYDKISDSDIANSVKSAYNIVNRMRFVYKNEFARLAEELADAISRELEVQCEIESIKENKVVLNISGSRFLAEMSDIRNNDTNIVDIKLIPGQ